jgi:hypothetical protein
MPPLSLDREHRSMPSDFAVSAKNKIKKLLDSTRKEF